jgi:23S rRNA A1618 N6-methylase RlmF
MPATSLKQKKFMDAVAHNPAFAKKVGVPKAVGKDFSEASKGMKFGKGSGSRADAQAINKPKTNQGKNELFAKGGEMAESKAMVKKEVSFMKKKGAPASMIKHEESEMKVKKMAKGGMTASKMGAVKTAAPSRDGVAAKGKTKGKMIVMPGNKGMKNGGKC